MGDLRVGGAFMPSSDAIITGNWTFATDHLTSARVGTIPVAQANTVTTIERGLGTYHQTVFTMNATPVTVSDTSVGGGVKIYTFPEGRIFILGAVGTSAINTISALTTLNSGVTANWGVGSVITAAQASGTLTTTEQDIIPTTNVTSSTTAGIIGAATSGVLAAAAQFDGTSTAMVLNWNIGVAAAGDIDANASIQVTASITVTWIWLGDI